MSGKKENRKMMDVLERMKMVRKVDDLPAQADGSEDTPPPPAPPEVEAFFAAPAPVSPPSKKAPPAPAPAPAPVSPAPAPTPTPTPSAPVAASYMPAPTPKPVPMPAPAPAAAQSANNYNFGAAQKRETAQEKSFWDDATPAGPDLNRFMPVNELYHSFLLKTNGTDTVYLIEEYMKTLPETLPAELRRSIIVRIMTASGFDFDKLLNDGIDRISRLNDYAEKFSSHTEEVIAFQNQEIAELEARIAVIREEVDTRKNLHKKQFLAIESEAQRLKEILDFVTK